jgi:hypothetical protein
MAVKAKLCNMYQWAGWALPRPHFWIHNFFSFQIMLLSGNLVGVTPTLLLQLSNAYCIHECFNFTCC